MTWVRRQEGKNREGKERSDDHVVFMNFYPKLTDWIFSLTCSVPKCVIMRSVSSFSNLLERGFSCVSPPVNLQVILTLKRFSARLTDEISDPCKKKKCCYIWRFTKRRLRQDRCIFVSPPEWMIMWRCRWFDR